jgi:hypothetical protein
MSDVLYVNLDALTTEYNKKIDAAMGKLQNFDNKAVDMGKNLSLAVSLPLTILGFTMVKSASDMEESINKVDVAFKESSASVKAFAKTSLESFGISQAAALEAASLFGDMATSMGFSTKSAAEMSKQLVGLQGDLMSFKNVNEQVASTALKGIFSGETESLKELGIVMTEANLKAFALSKGIKTNMEDMTQAQKVSLRYAYIMDVTKNAQGDFVRTQDGAANQMRIFKGLVSEVSTSLGSIMLPIFNSVVHKVNELSKEFLALDENAKTNILIGGGLAILIGPALIAIGSIATAITNIGVLLGGLMTPIGLFTVGLVAAAAYVLTHWEEVKNFFVDLETQILKLKVLFNIAAFSMGATAVSAFGDMDKSIEKVTRWQKTTSNPMAKIVAGMKTASKDIMAFFNELESGEPKMKNANKAVQDYTFEIKLLGIETEATRKRIEDLNAQAEKTKQIGFTPDSSKNTKEHLNDLKKQFDDIANAIGFDGEASSKKLQERYNQLIQPLAENISYSPQIMDAVKKLGINISDGFSGLEIDGIMTYIKKIQAWKGLLQNVLQNTFHGLADIVSTGLASMFNQDVKFEPKKMIAQVLSSVGEMLIGIAVPLVAALALGNVATMGGMSVQWGAALGMLGAGIAMKGGGMAMSANSNLGTSTQRNTGGGGGSNGPAFGMGGLNITFNPVVLEAQGSALKGAIDVANYKFG